MNAFESPRPEDRLSELNELATAALNENLSDEQAARLDQLVCEDEAFRKQYIRYMYVSWNLRAWAKFPPATVMEGQIEPLMPADIDEALLRQLEVSPSEPLRSSFPSVLGGFFHGTVGFFSQEVPFSLLIATVVTGLGLLMGSFVYVTHHKQIADSPAQPTPLIGKSDMEFVGRVTGMVDVKWSDINTSTEHGNGIPLGRRFALASGLMEITYDTGAKVILQGPCTYQADSRDGGFLCVGKLTAKLDNAKPQAANQKTEIKNQKSSVSANHYPLFTIKTPTAMVTDLGTEFGVEVSQEGNTTSHVFRGSVEFQALPADKAQKPIVRVLHANESARIEYRNAWNGGNRMIVSASPDDAVAFVREISKQTRQRSDRFEVVAYWQFDDKDFLTDSSGHGHTLVNHGVTQIDGTAAFDGKAILSTVDSIDLTPYKRIRVSWQQKTASLATPQVAWEQSSNFNGAVGAIASVLQYGKANAGIRTTGEALAQGYRQDLYNIDQYPALIDVWETLTVEYDRTAYRANVVRVFKDGKEIPTTSLFDGFAPASFINAPFHIGARDGPINAFVGQIENLKIEGITGTKKR